MDSEVKKELRSLLRQARKDGRKPFAGYIKEGDGSIHVLLLADASEFVYHRLKKHEPILLAAFQAEWPDRNIVKVTVVPRFNNQDVCDAIALRLGIDFHHFQEYIEYVRNTRSFKLESPKACKPEKANDTKHELI
jgi:hypothetical protein